MGSSLKQRLGEDIYLVILGRAVKLLRENLAHKDIIEELFYEFGIKLTLRNIATFKTNYLVDTRDAVVASLTKDIAAYIKDGSEVDSKQEALRSIAVAGGFRDYGASKFSEAAEIGLAKEYAGMSLKAIEIQGKLMAQTQEIIGTGGVDVETIDEEQSRLNKLLTQRLLPKKKKEPDRIGAKEVEE